MWLQEETHSIAEKYNLQILREWTDIGFRKLTSVDCRRRHGTSMKLPNHWRTVQI
jgi:hypothetical protein